MTVTKAIVKNKMDQHTVERTINTASFIFFLKDKKELEAKDMG